MTRIHWTEDENRLVANRTAELRLLHPKPMLHRVVEMAQEVLPEHRRRKFNSPDNLGREFMEMLEGRLVLMVRPQQVVKPAEPVVTTIPIEIETVRDPDPQLFLRGLPDYLIVGEAIMRIFSRQDRPLVPLMEMPPIPPTFISRPGATVPDRDAVARERLPRVAIVGLLKDQFQAVEDKLREKEVELRYVDASSRQTDIPPADAVVILVSKVGHHWSSKAITQAGRDRVMYADGVTTVVQRVLDFLSRRRR